MTLDNKNWLSYFIVLALIWLPLQNGMAMPDAVNSSLAMSSECQQGLNHPGSHQQMQQAVVDKNCCDSDSDFNCQQSCNKCLVCPATTAVFAQLLFYNDRSQPDLNAVVSPFSDSTYISPHLRPPQA